MPRMKIRSLPSLGIRNSENVRKRGNYAEAQNRKKKAAVIQGSQSDQGREYREKSLKEPKSV